MQRNMTFHGKLYLELNRTLHHAASTVHYAPQVEVYLDLACSDCALAWPVMTRVAKAYGQQTNFIYRLFPLPYHNNAFAAAQVRFVFLP